MENIFWKGYSNDERHAAIDKVKTVISKYGDVVDFHFFSDISITIIIEIEELTIKQLAKELGEIIGLDAPDYLESISKKERKIYLNMTFSKGTGNLKIDTPVVPG